MPVVMKRPSQKGALTLQIGFCVGIAKLADHFGRQTMVIGSWIVFIAFSVACGSAKSMAQL